MELTIADARLMRQNCATVLGLVMTLTTPGGAPPSGDAKPRGREPLREMKDVPE